MNIVMDFDGVFTDPIEEGELCSKYFKERVESLNAMSLADMDSWFGELRARLASRAMEFGWRSEGRISAFYFEDPFIRAIGFADFLDQAAASGEARAVALLKALQKDGLESFGALSEWAFHQLRVVKRADPEAVEWVKKQHELGHKITIVSNSSPEKIQDFLMRANLNNEVSVRGDARKFELGKKTKKISLAGFDFDVSRPAYEEALLELQPDLVIGDVFSLDLALPISLKREGKIPFTYGAVYRLRSYTPRTLLDGLVGSGNAASKKVEELVLLESWNRFKI